MQLFKIPIKYSWLWLPALLLIPYLHLEKIMFFIFLILSVHEFSHIMVAMLFHYKIKQVIVYPFGLSAVIPELGYGSIYAEVCIIVAGPLSQIMFPLFFQMLVSAQIISHQFCEYLMMMNANIMVFNLLPIYPLDGGRLLQSFFHSIIHYKRAQQITCICSLVVLLVLMVIQSMHGLSGLVVQMFLCIQIIICYRDIVYDAMKFYHYRYHHPLVLPMIRNTKKDLYRSRYNLMKTSVGWMDETSWLNAYFASRKR